MKRTPVNPWPWSLNFGYNQAEILDGATKHLICAGQTCSRRRRQPATPRRHAWANVARSRQSRDRPESRRYESRQRHPTHPLRHRRRRSPQKLRPARRAIRPPQRRSSNDLTRRHATRHPAPHVRDRGYRRRLISTFSEILRPRFANPIGGRRGYGSQTLSRSSGKESLACFILESRRYESR